MINKKIFSWKKNNRNIYLKYDNSNSLVLVMTFCIADMEIFAVYFYDYYRNRTFGLWLKIYSKLFSIEWLMKQNRNVSHQDVSTISIWLVLSAKCWHIRSYGFKYLVIHVQLNLWDADTFIARLIRPYIVEGNSKETQFTMRKKKQLNKQNPKCVLIKWVVD